MSSRCATWSTGALAAVRRWKEDVTKDELVDEAKDDRTASATWMQSFKAQVRADYDAQQYQGGTGRCRGYSMS